MNVKSFIVTEIDALFGAQGKLRAMMLNGLVLVITAVITWLRLSRFATPDEILTWSTAITGLLVTAITHFLDSHIGNANVQTGPQIPAALMPFLAGLSDQPLPPAVQPLPPATPSSTQSQTPSA